MLPVLAARGRALPRAKPCPSRSPTGGARHRTRLRGGPPARIPSWSTPAPRGPRWPGAGRAAGPRPGRARLVVTPAGDETRLVVDLGRVSVGAARGRCPARLDRGRGPASDRRGRGRRRAWARTSSPRFDYTIDYRRRVLAWDGAGGRGRRPPGPAPQRGALPGRPAAAGVRDRPLRFVPDSGATGWWSSSARAASASRWIRLPGGSEVESASGRRRARGDAARPTACASASLTLRDQIAAAVEPAARPRAGRVTAFCRCISSPA